MVLTLVTGSQVAVVQFSNDVRVELPLEPLSDVDAFKSKISRIVGPAACAPPSPIKSNPCCVELECLPSSGYCEPHGLLAPSLSAGTPSWPSFDVQHMLETANLSISKSSTFGVTRRG